MGVTFSVFFFFMQNMVRNAADTLSDPQKSGIFLSGSALYLMLQMKVNFLWKYCVYQTTAQHHRG